MSFRNIKEFIDSYDAGKYQISSFRKVPSQSTVSGTWVDLSMASGNPSPNFYSGIELESTLFDGNKGIYAGEGDKYLKSTLILNTSTAQNNTALTLCDYLMYYPQIDMDSLDLQATNNTVTLPRYESGDGVRMFLVAQYPYVGNVFFTVYYTNSDGVSGRSTGAVRANTTANIGSIIHSATSLVDSYGCFLPLQSGDRGVRSVESIQFASPCGGLGAIVLVKPLINTINREAGAPVEKESFIHGGQFPEIKDGAYLNFIALPSANIATVALTGLLEFTWS